jgi:hypothetical protein
MLRMVLLRFAAGRITHRFIPRLPAKAHALPMRFLKKLTNPFVLVAEGFLVGAILFATSTPDLVEPRRAPPPALDSSVIPNPAR